MQYHGFIDLIYLEHVCRLKKAFYGFKQAPQESFLQISNALVDFGFVSSFVDTSLFTFYCEKVHIFVLIYIDYLLIRGLVLAFLKLLLSSSRRNSL